MLVGGCRNVEDERRVAELKRIVSDLGIERNVVFEVNVGMAGSYELGAVRADAGVSRASTPCGTSTSASAWWR